MGNSRHWGRACAGINRCSGLQRRNTEDSPPRLALRVLSMEKAGDHFLVRVEVANKGGSTAAEAHVEAELRENGTVIERSETTIDFVPPNSKRKVGVFFRRAIPKGSK